MTMDGALVTGMEHIEIPSALIPAPKFFVEWLTTLTVRIREVMG
jgi:hypothetical protein